MTKDDMIRMARIAGVRDDENRFEFSEYKYLERFYNLAVAAERERLAKMFCDNVLYRGEDCAASIRARSQP